MLHALAAVLLTAIPDAGPPQNRSGDFNAMLDAYWEEYLPLHPIQATAIGDSRYNDRFYNDLTPQARAQMHAFHTRWLARLLAFPREALAGQDRLSFDTLSWVLQVTLEGERFPDHLLPCSQYSCGALDFAQLGSGESLQPFKTVKDYEDFLKRGDGFVGWMDQAVVNMREGIQKGVVQPKQVMQKLVPELDQLCVTEPEQSVFWGAIKVMPADIKAPERARMTAAYRRAIGQRWLPALRRLRDFVRDEYVPSCRATSGYGQLPDGRAWYAWAIKASTTTQMEPEVIHQLGQAEVARIRQDMDAVRRQVGFKGDLHAFFKHLEDDPAFYFTKPEDLLAGHVALQAKVEALLPKAFDLFPKTPLVVKAVEPFRAQSASGAEYQVGSADGSRPGTFYVNTFNLKAQPKFGMETLFLHEASPGHHFQFSLARELESLPKFRRFSVYSAYAEGWALYTESLGKELGLYTDPYAWFGHLADGQLRAMRLVVDTGLHAKGWSREQSIAFMRDNSSMADSDIVAEVERYMVWPGQALSYKLGQFAIRELRTQAEKELGPRFNLKAFHRQVLIDGPLPLDVLKTKIRAWIASEKARPDAG